MKLTDISYYYQVYHDYDYYF